MRYGETKVRSHVRDIVAEYIQDYELIKAPHNLSNDPATVASYYATNRRILAKLRAPGDATSFLYKVSQY
jgi:hypothetical protein